MGLLIAEAARYTHGNQTRWMTLALKKVFMEATNGHNEEANLLACKELANTIERELTKRRTATSHATPANKSNLQQRQDGRSLGCLWKVEKSDGK